MKPILFSAAIFLLLTSYTCSAKLELNFIQDVAALEKSINSIELITWDCYGERELVQFKPKLHWSYNYHKVLPSIADGRASANRKLFVVDFRCEAAQDNFQTIDVKFFEHPFRWLVMLDSVATMSYFQKFPLLQASNVIVGFPTATGSANQRQIIELRQVYKIRDYRPLEVENFGWWSNVTGLNDQRITKVLSRRRMNFQGEELIASNVFLTNKTYSLMYNRLESEVDRPLRVVFNQMNALMDLFNGTKRYIFTPTFGYDETGIWIGNSGNLINDHADIAIAPFFVTLQRLHALDYLASILPTHGYFVFRAPQLSTVANLYTLPFSRMVWISFGVLVLVCCVAIFVLMRAEHFKERGRQKTSFSDVMLLTVAGICQMGTSLNARFNASRLMTVSKPSLLILCRAWF